MSSKKGVDLIKSFNTFMRNSKGYDSVMKNVIITDGGNGNCTAEFKVLPEYLNKLGGLHGGFTATLVDNITTYALMSKELPGIHGGVSVDLHVSYLKGAKEGDDVIIDARTIRAGKRLAFLECELKHKDGSIIAKGSHTKYVGQ